MTNDEEASSGATPGSRGCEGVGTRTKSGPSLEEQLRTTEPPTPLLKQGPSQLMAGGSRAPPPSQPGSRDPTGGQAKSGGLRAPGAGFQSVGKEGSPAEGPAART